MHAVKGSHYQEPSQLRAVTAQGSRQRQYRARCDAVLDFC